MGLRYRLAAAYFPRRLEALAWHVPPAPHVSVLMYHEVLPDDFSAPHWGVVRASDFRTQMGYLREHCDVLTLDEAVARMSAPRLEAVDDGSSGTRRSDANRARDGHSTRPAVVITFDDGYLGNFTCALPILEEHGLPFTVFVATAMVEQGTIHWYDKVALALLGMRGRNHRIRTSAGDLLYPGRRLLADRRWGAVHAVLTTLKALPPAEREAIAASMPRTEHTSLLRMMDPACVRALARHPLATIGNHTHGHEMLDQVPAAVGRASIQQSLALLEDWTARRPRHFAYPNGNVSPGAMELVGQFGFECAMATGSRLWTMPEQLFAIPRLPIGRFDNLNIFRAWVCGYLSRTAPGPVAGAAGLPADPRAPADAARGAGARALRSAAAGEANSSTRRGSSGR